ncbi:MAG: hypothetical protein U0638_02175 [Phycisphaerales bacterium]
MESLSRVFFPVLFGVLLSSLLSAYSIDKHAITQPEDGKVAVCRSCYDEISKLRSTQPRTGITTTRTITTHMCPDCKSELSVYTEGSTLKAKCAKCAKCAPDGADGDRCVPKPETK